MWVKDFPEQDPDSNYDEPSVKQLRYVDQAKGEVRQLKATLEKLTVPQQRAVIGELSGRIFRREASAIKATVPAHESEAQALTEASQTSE